MKVSFSSIFSYLISKKFYAPNKGELFQNIKDAPYFPDIKLDHSIQDLFKEYKVKSLIQYGSPFIDANELVIDSLKAFQSPFKTSVLVCEDEVVAGTLNLSSVINSLSVSCDIKSNIDLGNPVRRLMSSIFIPIEYNSTLSEIIVDVLNCESQIHPVYHNSLLKGVLHKDTVIDIVKLQMLFEAIHT